MRTVLNKPFTKAMVLASYPPGSRDPRVTLAGEPQRLEPIGQVLRELFPADVLVSSDEDDELDPTQLELLQEMADYDLAIRVTQPEPIARSGGRSL